MQSGRMVMRVMNFTKCTKCIDSWSRCLVFVFMDCTYIFRTREVFFGKEHSIDAMTKHMPTPESQL